MITTPPARAEHFYKARKMKRAGIWFLIALALLAGTISAVLSLSSNARLVASILIAPLFNNSRPPPIAQGVITSEDWPHFGAASKKLSAVLEVKFPAGSSENRLKSTLLGQDFHFMEPAPSDCVPPGRDVPVGVMFYRCLTAEQEQQRQRTLVYKWVSGVCAEFVYVRWSSDELGGLTHVEGSYYGACL